MKGGLTKRQKDGYDFIVAFIQTYEFAPSYQEISDGIGLHSKNGVHRIVHALKERNMIDDVPKRKRSIRILLNQCPYCKAMLP